MKHQIYDATTININIWQRSIYNCHISFKLVFTSFESIDEHHYKVSRSNRILIFGISAKVFQNKNDNFLPVELLHIFQLK